MAEKKRAEIVWKETNDGVDFQAVADLLNRSFAGAHEPVNKPGYAKERKEWVMAHKKANSRKDGHLRTEEYTRKIFTASYGVVYAFDEDKVVACGRILSDGLEQAAIYNIAVDPDYQGYGLGKGVIQRLLDQVKGCTVILYTHPQTVKFYETIGWRRQKTAFMIHSGGTFSDFEKNEGFILPEGYRYQPVDESLYYEVPPEHENQLD